MDVTRGKLHDLSVDGEVIIIMIDYIMNLIYDLPDDMYGKKLAPASNHFFAVGEK